MPPTTLHTALARVCSALILGLLAITFTGSERSRARIIDVPSPEDVIGFRPGEDRKLASWQSIVEYFRKLAASSDRMEFSELGKTTMGAPFVMATISSPENLAHLGEYREIQAQLADHVSWAAIRIVSSRTDSTRQNCRPDYLRNTFN